MSILNPLFDAVAWVIMRIHAVLAVPFGQASGWSWGLSIVLLVMLMRLIMVPLFVKQVNSQRKMQSHMPQLQEIRKRYKSDKTRLNEETMKFYKENGINPLGGCLPLVAQLPVFWSLFNVLKAIADWTSGTPKYGLTIQAVQSARTAHVFGVLLSDKFLWATTGESWVVRVVILASVLISACTTFLTMRQSAKRGMMNQQVPDPDQPGAAMAANMSKNMMYIAPFFALTGLYWQYGLVIYWVTTNLWTLGQQHFLFRNLPVVGSTTADTSAVGAASGGSAPVVKTTVVKSSAVRSAPARSAVAKSNGSASNGTAKTASSSNGSARTASASNGSARTASKSAASGLTSSATRAKVPAAKTAAAKAPTASAKSPAAKAPAAKAPAAKPPTAAADSAKTDSAKTDTNGATPAVNGGSTETASTGRGLRGLGSLGRKKAEPEPEPAVTEIKIARQQPVRQTRSKRSGTPGTSGKR